MVRKYRGYLPILSGVLFLCLGILLIRFRNQAIFPLIRLVGIVSVALGGIGLIQVPFLIMKSGLKRGLGHVGQSLVQILLGLVFYFSRWPNSFLTGIILGYFLWMGITYAITWHLLRRDGVHNRRWNLVQALLNLTFVGIIAGNTAARAPILYEILGWYLVLVGLSALIDEITYLKTEPITNLKRRIRITLPAGLSALLPYQALLAFNRFMAEGQQGEQLPYVKKEEESDLKVWVHANPKGFGRFGHVDITYKGFNYSYGAYDKFSNRLFGTLGDGVLRVIPHEDYEKAIEKNKDRLAFVYGIHLTNEQRERVESRLQEILSQTVPFDNRKMEQTDAYTQRVNWNHTLKAYKFRGSRFRSYFVFSTNCVQLADAIVGQSGIDIINISGIISPGSYYAFLEQEYRRPHSRVVSKTVYYPQAGRHHALAQKIAKERSSS
ncbi:hypothetical protein ABB02_01776 [Clostridiaceae bacterium JG1575]|nr:hypothetical protein ABB02_01776 [Clostridiaceae bacterium JG1575]